ncbi:MAG: hypothetical protein QXI58_06095 [Candidatus Micrarchaeia archaeon]
MRDRGAPAPLPPLTPFFFFKKINCFFIIRVRLFTDNDKVRICSNAELKVKGKILIVPIDQVPIDQALIDQEDLTLLVEEENHLILLPLIGNISYAIVVLPEPKEKT